MVRTKVVVSTTFCSNPVRQHRAQVGRLDRAEADHDQQTGERRHGDPADEIGEGQDRRHHHQRGDHQRDPRPGPRLDVERRGRHRPAHRHPLEDAGRDVGRALPDEVAGGVRERPSGLGNAAETPAPWTRPMKASERAGTRSSGTSARTGASGIGSERGTSLMSLRTTTEVQPSTAAAAEATAIATTRPRAPTRVRSSTRMSTTVPSSRRRRSRGRAASGFITVSIARMTRLAPLGVVAREVGELAEHDVDPDGREEAHHDGVGHETQ